MRELLNQIIAKDKRPPLNEYTGELIQAKGAQVVGLDGSENEFDVVLQIYGQLNTFSPDSRDRLLACIRMARKDNGIDTK